MTHLASLSATSRMQKSDDPGFARSVLARRTRFELLLGFLLLCVATMSAQSYKDIFEFNGSTNGCCPQYPAIMAQGQDGNLYGVTPTGGTSNVGIAFKITPTGTQTVLYNFDVTHGSNPNGGLVMGTDGNFYGTSEHGGAHAYGNIFQLTPAGALKVIYDFTGGSDGGYPLAPPIQGTDGNFYGSTYPGIAYKISTKGAFKVIKKIPATPYGPLVQGTDGAFYGMTEQGGTSGVGTIFRILKTTVTTLYNFDGTHGAYPYGALVQGADGNFYGTTSGGGSANAGIIFQVTAKGALSLLYNFDPAHPANGYQAFAGLVAATDGNLYGSTIFGGSGSSGVLFKITTAGTYSVLSNFDTTHGAGAYPTPLQCTSGKFFGLTSKGGTAGKGVAYSLDNGVGPFVALTSTLGLVGKPVGVLGNGLTGTTAVKFNGATAKFNVVSDTYLTATVPSGETGFITVTTPSGTLSSSKQYFVTPKILSFSPPSGAVGTSVVISGSGLIQTTTITLGGVKVTSYSVDSDKQVTITVPTGAKSGKIVVTTPGGKATSSKTFTVTI